MSDAATLKAETREKVGSRDARKLRRDGRIPASLPTDGKSPHVNIHIDESEFLKTRRQHVHLYDIDIGGELEAALVRELQWDALGDHIVHVEFKRVQRGVETEVEVELEFVGHPKVGILNHLVTQITIRTIPSKIPDSIPIKIGELEPGDHVRAADLDLPEGVSLAIAPETEIALVSVERVIEDTAEPIPETPPEGEVADGEGDESPSEG